MRTGASSHYRHIRRGTGASLEFNPYSGTGAAHGQLTTTNGESAGATHYFEVGGGDDCITSVMIRWTDATSSAAITLETTNLPLTLAAHNVAAGSSWYPETTVSITGPTATAAGCFMLHMGNNAARRNRLKVVVAATTQLEIISYGIH